MNERIKIELEEGERHPHHEPDWSRELRALTHVLRSLLDSQHEQTRLLRLILEREPKPTYPRPTGVKISVE